MLHVNEDDWKAFYFRGTHYNGYVFEKSVWDEVVNLYKSKGHDTSFLLKAKMVEVEKEKGVPVFALQPNNGLTLGGWAGKNNVNLL